MLIYPKSKVCEINFSFSFVHRSTYLSSFLKVFVHTYDVVSLYVNMRVLFLLLT